MPSPWFRSLVGVPLVLTVVAAPAHAIDRHVTIVNDTHYDIVSFYGSRVNAGGWESDILGEEVLKSGYSFDVDFDNASGDCIYDFRADFSDGYVLVKSQINVCEIGTYRYHE